MVTFSLHHPGAVRRSFGVSFAATLPCSLGTKGTKRVHGADVRCGAVAAVVLRGACMVVRCTVSSVVTIRGAVYWAIGRAREGMQYLRIPAVHDHTTATAPGALARSRVAHSLSLCVRAQKGDV